LPQLTAAQELQIKAQNRLASLMEEKLVTRISVLSTLLGRGKTTERLLVRISIETHKIECGSSQCRHITTDVADDTAACLKLISSNHQ